MSYEEREAKVRAKAKAIGQITELRRRQEKKRNLAEKMWANKFKLLALLYFVVNLLWRLVVSKKILKT